MPQPEIEIVGLKDAIRRLNKVDPDLRQEITEAHKEGAERVAGTAKPKIPYLTGDLASSLRTSATPAKGIVRVGFKKTPYAGPIHFGWPNRPNPSKNWRGGPIRPLPFLFDALSVESDNIVRDFEERVKNVLEKAFPD